MDSIKELTFFSLSILFVFFSGDAGTNFFGAIFFPVDFLGTFLFFLFGSLSSSVSDDADSETSDSLLCTDSTSSSSVSVICGTDWGITGAFLLWQNKKMIQLIKNVKFVVLIGVLLEPSYYGNPKNDTTHTKP